VILAGVDGTRLKTLTRAIAGDERPKQFCSVIGESALLEKTQRRMALLMNPVQTFTIVTRAHERFYRNHLKHWPMDRLLIQPENKGTAPAILLSLLRMRQLSPEAVVAFFPSNHHFTVGSFFMSQVALAFDLVEAHASSITLLGMQPDDSEQQ
jgi:mannose-1-phosphate guanylyltransferase